MQARTKRLIASMLIAPIVLASIWGVIGLAVGGPQAALFIGLYALVAAFFGTILFGVPTHFALHKSKQYGLGDYLIASVVIGLVPVFAAAIPIFTNTPRNWGLPLIYAAVILPSCLITAGTAWKIARPDLS